MPVGGVRAEDDHAPPRYAIASKLVIGECLASEDPGRRIQPYRFLEHHRGVGQLRELLKRWRFSTKDRRQFTMQPTLHLRVLREQVPGPDEGIGRGLMTCQEEGHHLVT